MRIIVQRSLESSVEVDKKVVGSIPYGVVVLVGFTEGDTDKEIKYLADKLVNLRIFDDEEGVMNKSLLDTGGSILSISQFTLYADATKGRRPSYVKALNGEKAKILYDKWNNELRKLNANVETGIFGADMKVRIINDGPVTIAIEKEGNKNG